MILAVTFDQQKIILDLSNNLANKVESHNCYMYIKKISKYYLHMLRLAPYIRSIRTRFCRLKSVHRSMWRNSFQTNLKMFRAVFTASLNVPR
jgi:hypothetical protein